VRLPPFTRRWLHRFRHKSIHRVFRSASAFGCAEFFIKQEIRCVHFPSSHHPLFMVTAVIRTIMPHPHGNWISDWNPIRLTESRLKSHSCTRGGYTMKLMKLKARIRNIHLSSSQCYPNISQRNGITLLWKVMPSKSNRELAQNCAGILSI